MPKDQVKEKFGFPDIAMDSLVRGRISLWEYEKKVKWRAREDSNL